MVDVREETGRRPRRPPIDPRIRERRIEVRRHEGRRRLRVLLGVLAAVALGATGLWTTRSALLDVDHVRVLGASHTPVRAVEAAGLAPGRPMVEVPGDSVRRLEALPWVATARVERRWPGTVEVRLTERVPVALLPAAPGWGVLADADGRLLEAAPEPVAGLPRLVGAPLPGRPGEEADPVVRPALAVAGLLGPLAARVPEVRLRPDGELELAMAKSKGTVLFGPPAQVGEKLVALATMFDHVEDLANVKTLDVRVPSAPALTRQGSAPSSRD